MSFGWQLKSGGFTAFYVLFWILLSCAFQGWVLAAVVTLDSMTIYKTHELLGAKPTVYFNCKGENKIELPDVKEVNVSYTFKGQESWQPLTNLTSKKCKRCGFYEKDRFNSDDVFDEWEFCPSDFKDSNGKYERLKEKEFVVTFLCPQCVPLSSDSNPASGSHDGGKKKHIAFVIIVSAFVSTVLIIGTVIAYKYWQKKKREQDQARFLKMFEEGDDIEDELELGTVI